jgi:hypothetical protein
MEKVEVINNEFINVEFFKTPEYIRKSQENYRNRLKTQDRDGFNKRNCEYMKKYLEKKKDDSEFKSHRKEYMKEYMKNYYQANKEKLIKYNCEKNKDKKEYMKEYYQKNKLKRKMQEQEVIDEVINNIDSIKLEVSEGGLSPQYPLIGLQPNRVSD